MKKFYFLILSVLFNINLCISQIPAITEGFPRVLDSAGYEVSYYSYIPMVVDLNKNGQKQIIITTKYHIYVIKSDGTNYPGFPFLFNDVILDFAVGDVDNDGSLDIAFRTMTKVNVINRFGINLPGFPVDVLYSGLYTGSSFISLYDLDHNGLLSIIVLSYDQDARQGIVIVFDSYGDVRPGWPKYSDTWYKNHPAIGDIDGNGIVDIILTGSRKLPAYPYYDSSRVEIYKSDGTLFSNNWPFHVESNYLITLSSSPSLFINQNNPDSTFICISSFKSDTKDWLNYQKSNELNQSYQLNEDDQHIIVGNELSSGNQNNYKIYRLGIYGNIKKLNEHLILHSDLGTLCMGDVNNDGLVEFASGTQYGDEMILLDYNLNPLPGWPQYGFGCHYAPTLIGKVSSASSLNIINLRWSAEGNYGSGIFNVYDYQGNHLSFSSMRPYGLVCALSLGGLTGGNTEILVSSMQRLKLYVHSFTFPGIQYSNVNFPWPQLAHDRYHTNQYGFIPPDEPIGINPVSEEIPEQYKLYQNYPNPFNPQTTIQFDVPLGNTTVKLEIYDILGRNVFTLLNQQLKPGKYSAAWNASGYSSGIYFCAFYTNNKLISTNKLILVK